MIAGPVVSPGKTAFNKSLVDGFEGFFHADDGAGGQNFDFNFAVGEGGDVGGEFFQHHHFVGLGRNHGLDADNGLGHRAAGEQSRCKHDSKYRQQSVTHI